MVINQNQYEQLTQKASQQQLGRYDINKINEYRQKVLNQRAVYQVSPRSQGRGGQWKLEEYKQKSFTVGDTREGTVIRPKDTVESTGYDIQTRDETLKEELTRVKFNQAASRFQPRPVATSISGGQIFIDRGVEYSQKPTVQREVATSVKGGTLVQQEYETKILRTLPKEQIGSAPYGLRQVATSRSGGVLFGDVQGRIYEPQTERIGSNVESTYFREKKPFVSENKLGDRYLESGAKLLLQLRNQVDKSGIRRQSFPRSQINPITSAAGLSLRRQELQSTPILRQFGGLQLYGLSSAGFGAGAVGLETGSRFFSLEQKSVFSQQQSKNVREYFGTEGVARLGQTYRDPKTYLEAGSLALLAPVGLAVKGRIRPIETSGSPQSIKITQIEKVLGRSEIPSSKRMTDITPQIQSLPKTRVNVAEYYLNRQDPLTTAVLGRVKIKVMENVDKGVIRITQKGSDRQVSILLREGSQIARVSSTQQTYSGLFGFTRQTSWRNLPRDSVISQMQILGATISYEPTVKLSSRSQQQLSQNIVSQYLRDTKYFKSDFIPKRASRNSRIMSGNFKLTESLRVVSGSERLRQTSGDIITVQRGNQAQVGYLPRSVDILDTQLKIQKNQFDKKLRESFATENVGQSLQITEYPNIVSQFQYRRIIRGTAYERPFRQTQRFSTGLNIFDSKTAQSSLQQIPRTDLRISRPRLQTRPPQMARLQIPRFRSSFIPKFALSTSQSQITSQLNRQTSRVNQQSRLINSQIQRVGVQQRLNQSLRLGAQQRLRNRQITRLSAISPSPFGRSQQRLRIPNRPIIPLIPKIKLPKTSENKLFRSSRRKSRREGEYTRSIAAAFLAKPPRFDKRLAQATGVGVRF
jgi:hypothetical protein